jgi:NAD(P)-dependent dehydrogenase (short-subunit alcohol dehydrogenase family)
MTSYPVTGVPGQRRGTLVLGATGSLGSDLSRRLLGLSDTLFVQGPDAERTAALAVELSALDDRCRVVPLAADFADLGAAEALLRTGLLPGGGLDVLINAVDLAPPSSRTITTDGNELTWQVNYLAPARVVLGALPLLRRGPAGRVVHVVRDQRSGLARSAGGGSGERYYPAWAYTETKLALMMFNQTVAERLADSTCRTVAMRPSGLELATHSPADPDAALLARRLMVDAVLYACTSPTVPNGAYLHGRSPHHLPRAASGAAAQTRLWRNTCRALRLDPRTGQPLGEEPDPDTAPWRAETVCPTP